jgi:hypothetical protein
LGASLQHALNCLHPPDHRDSEEGAAAGEGVVDRLGQHEASVADLRVVGLKVGGVVLGVCGCGDVHEPLGDGRCGVVVDGVFFRRQPRALGWGCVPTPVRRPSKGRYTCPSAAATTRDLERS